jgi:hypothetical protein
VIPCGPKLCTLFVLALPRCPLCVSRAIFDRPGSGVNLAVILVTLSLWVATQLGARLSPIRTDGQVSAMLVAARSPALSCPREASGANLKRVHAIYIYRLSVTVEKGAGPAKWPGRPTRRDKLSEVWRAARNRRRLPSVRTVPQPPAIRCAPLLSRRLVRRFSDGSLSLTADFLTSVPATVTPQICGHDPSRDERAEGCDRRSRRCLSDATSTDPRPSSDAKREHRSTVGSGAGGHPQIAGLAQPAPGGGHRYPRVALLTSRCDPLVA